MWHFAHLFIRLLIHFCGGFSCSTQLKTYISYLFEFKVMFALVENGKWIIYIYFVWGFFIGYLYFTLWIFNITIVFQISNKNKLNKGDYVIKQYNPSCTFVQLVISTCMNSFEFTNTWENTFLFNRSMQMVQMHQVQKWSKHFVTNYNPKFRSCYMFP